MNRAKEQYDALIGPLDYWSCTVARIKAGLEEGDLKKAKNKLAQVKRKLSALEKIIHSKVYETKHR